MLLAIDIGNTSTKFGIYHGDKLVSKFSIPTIRDYNVRELILGHLRLLKNELGQDMVDAAIVSSVVPEVDTAVTEVCLELLRITPNFVNSSYDFDLKVLYEPPASVGIDRLVAAFAAVEKYGSPCIVCDFGTATTIDAVNTRREYLGGTITPGMKTMAQSLANETSKLPDIAIEKPANVIGNSTVGSIQSGIFFGYIGLVEGIIRRMVSEIGGTTEVVATGGFASLIAENCEAVKIVDENLILDGLRILSQRNSK